MLIERYHWSLAEVSQLDDADPDFMVELLAMLEAITGKSHEQTGKQEFQDFKSRHKQRIGALQGKR